MSTQKEARPLVAQEAGQAGTAACDSAAIPYDYCTTGGAKRQPFRVADFLGRGRDGAQTMKELRELLHVDNRKIRLMIQKERRHVPIVADCQRGYWIADSTEDVNAFCRSMRARADEIRRTARFVERAAGIGSREPMPGQCDFWSGDNGT